VPYLHVESKIFHYSGNVPIHYQAGGHGPLPLIFLHGFAAAHTTWHDIAGLFPADRFRIFLLDLKGFGLSAKPRDNAYAIEDQAAMVQAFIREQGLRSVILVGHSLGGAVALHVCLETRQGQEAFTVEKLVLIGCAAYPKRLPKFFRRLKNPLIGPLLLRLIPARVMVRDTLAKVFYDAGAITPERFEQYLRYFRGKGIPYAMRATVKGLDPEARARMGERYRELAVPTLIIWGEEDRIIKLKYGHRLHGDLAGSQLKIMAKCGHIPHEERPAETYAAMEAFLASEDGPPQ
jgi:pimeloyl-ACP methyl ester carboxylesterase